MLLFFLLFVICTVCEAEVMTGGWESVSTIDPSLVNFAFKEYQQNPDMVKGLTEGCNLKNMGASDFAQQVVAGMNYRFVLSVEEKCPGNPQTTEDLNCFVQVYQNLDNTREVKWNAAICRPVRKGKLEGGLPTISVEEFLAINVAQQYPELDPKDNDDYEDVPQTYYDIPEVEVEFHEPTTYYQQLYAYQQQLAQQQLYADQQQLAQQQQLAYMLAQLQFAHHQVPYEYARYDHLPLAPQLTYFQPAQN